MKIPILTQVTSMVRDLRFRIIRMMCLGDTKLKLRVYYHYDNWNRNTGAELAQDMSLRDWVRNFMEGEVH